MFIHFHFSSLGNKIKVCEYLRGKLKKRIIRIVVVKDYLHFYFTNDINESTTHFLMKRSSFVHLYNVNSFF